MNTTTAIARSNTDSVTLHDGSLVDRRFYNKLKLAAEIGITKMKPGIPATFRKICGESVWLTLGCGEVILAGLCGVTLVRNDELPLTLLEYRDAQNARLYMLISQ